MHYERNAKQTRSKEWEGFEDGQHFAAFADLLCMGLSKSPHERPSIAQLKEAVLAVTSNQPSSGNTEGTERSKCVSEAAIDLKLANDLVGQCWIQQPLTSSRQHEAGVKYHVTSRVIGNLAQVPHEVGCKKVHENVLQPLSFSAPDGCLITENYLCSLKAWIDSRDSASFSDRCELVRQLTLGVRVLHEWDEAVDLNPKNVAVVMSEAGKMQLKVAGYGLFLFLQKYHDAYVAQSLESIEYAASYLAPEIWTETSDLDNNRAEIYSLCLIIVQLLT